MILVLLQKRKASMMYLAQKPARNLIHDQGNFYKSLFRLFLPQVYQDGSHNEVFITKTTVPLLYKDYRLGLNLA